MNFDQRSFTPHRRINKLFPAVADIPVYGSIPAGFAEVREQKPDDCVSVDVKTI